MTEPVVAERNEGVFIDTHSGWAGILLGTDWAWARARLGMNWARAGWVWKNDTTRANWARARARDWTRVEHEQAGHDTNRLSMGELCPNVTGTH
jgi:hypothetical protein